MIPIPSVGSLKRKAKALARTTGVPHHEALDKVVQSYAFANWAHYCNRQNNALPVPAIAAVPMGFEEYGDITITKAEASLLLQIALNVLPDLTYFGIGIYEQWKVRRTLGPDAVALQIAHGRKKLEDNLDQIAIAAAWIKGIEPTQTLNKRHTSYGYKHLVEDWTRRRIKAGESIPSYISNGSFIAAAVGLGLKFKQDGVSPNAFFNFSERSVKRGPSRLSGPVMTTSRSKNRKPVSIKGVTPLHYENRIPEPFAIGDEAWISFDARKALPVIVTAVSERHYDVSDDAGIYGLFHDEVRSTPELACINCVTS
jgi:hypothetical protein